MKPFRFSLQSIRVLREQKERDAQLRLAAAMRACEEAAFQLQEASDALAAGWSPLCEELTAGVAATSLVRTRAWCNVAVFTPAKFQGLRTALEQANNPAAVDQPSWIFRNPEFD